MKHMRKALALVLALIMVLGLAVSAYAEEGEKYDVTIKNATGHEYQIYQIFTGDLFVEADGDEILTNLKYGADYIPEGVKAGDLVPKEVLDTIEETATSIKPTGAGTAMTVADGVATATGLEAGYYMIVDVTDPLPENHTRSAVIFQVVGDTELTSKHDATPITEKKIDDVNDSTGEEAAIEWHDSADHDIGDLIDFQLSAVIPASIEAFREAKQAYPFTFHDVEEDGLTFTSITRVYVLKGETETEIPADQYQLITNTNDGCTFEVKFADLTTINAIRGGAKLIVEYKSKLNEKAILGEEGNVNKMCGEYRNYGNPETPAFTPWDAVIAFTYKVVVNKVDENGDALSGATFTLEKFEIAENGSVEYNGKKGEWVALSTVETNPETVFTFKGLDDGSYRLTEPKAPDGYNKIAPIEFSVTAEHTIEWEDQDRNDVLISLSGNKVVGEIVFAADEAMSTLTTKVENKAGVVLPETGGIGTTIFYILGGLLAVAAVVLLVTKKRMASAE